MIRFIFLMLFSAQLLAAGIELTWTLPELREDGSQIESITRFNLYHAVNNGSENVYAIDSTSTSHQISNAEEGTHVFRISTVEAEQEGPKSPAIATTVLAPVEIVISKPSYPALNIRVIQ